MHEWPLFFHILGAILLFAGIVLAATAFEAARRCDRIDEIAALLKVGRVGAILVATGTIAVLSFGLWLVELRGYDLTVPWVAGALILLATALVAGMIGGQAPKRARHLAHSLRDDKAPVPDALRHLLDDRVSIALNYCAAACIVAILFLMIFKPGT
jgi:uncharacterized membrane protein